MDKKSERIKFAVAEKIRKIDDAKIRNDFTKKFKQIKKESVNYREEDFITECKELIHEINKYKQKKNQEQKQKKKPKRKVKVNKELFNIKITPIRMIYDNGIPAGEGMTPDGKKMSSGALRTGVDLISNRRG